MTDLLTTKELQEILNIDRTTIYRMAESGRVPAVKVGNQWRFPKQQIETWLQRQSVANLPVGEPSAAGNGDGLQLFPLECVQLIQDSFADALSVMILVTDLNGVPVTKPSNPCGLYTVAESSPVARQRCLDLWVRLANEPTFRRIDRVGVVQAGLELVRQLRAWTAVPIIVLSARGREEDKVAALDAGADDYLTKPFGVRELFARIRVALRHRPGATATAVITAGAITIDDERHEVRVEDRVVKLTPIEYRLLALLVRHAGKVLTHRMLLKEIWGPNAVEHVHYVRVHMAALRAKIEANPSRPRWLLTEPGVGYRLSDGGDGGAP